MRAEEVRELALAEERFWWHRGRQRIVKRMLDCYVPRGARILDIGCGPGGTTLAYSESHNVLGVDASSESVRYARDRGIAVAMMDATRLGVRPDSCDAIVALDLLEHVADDARALREMYAALRPGGVLVATVPAYQFLWSSHDEAVGHLRRYTKGPLLRLVRAAGFEVTLGAYVMSSILPAAIVVRLAERLRPRRGEPAARFARLPRVLNVALERIVGFGPMPLRFVSIPFGLSIAVVARRPPTADRSASSRMCRRWMRA